MREGIGETYSIACAELLFRADDSTASCGGVERRFTLHDRLACDPASTGLASNLGDGFPVFGHCDGWYEEECLLDMRLKLSLGVVGRCGGKCLCLWVVLLICRSAMRLKCGATSACRMIHALAALGWHPCRFEAETQDDAKTALSVHRQLMDVLLASNQLTIMFALCWS